MKRALSSYVRPRVAEFVAGLARKMEVSVSSCVAMLLEQAMRSYVANHSRENSEDIPMLTRKDIECDLRECDDPANLITFSSKEDFLKDIDGIMEQILAEKKLSQRFGKACVRK